MFADAKIRQRVILAFFMSLATTFVFWGISTWIPPYIASIAGKTGLPPQQWASYAGLAYNGASVIGYAGFGFLADIYGRKPITIGYVLLAFLSVPILFLWTHELVWMLVAVGFCGMFVSGQYTWMAGLAAGILPDADAGHCRGFRVQYATVDRLGRPADLRLADRQRRRFQPGGDGDLVDLHPELAGRAVPAGDQGQTAAGVTGHPLPAQRRIVSNLN